MNEVDGPKGLGGWLILVGLGIVLTPFRVVIEAVSAYEPLFEPGVWAAISDPSALGYIPHLTTFLIAEMVVNFLFLIAYFNLLILFFQQHFRFPRWFIGLTLANFLAMVGNLILAARLLDYDVMADPMLPGMVLPSVFGVLVWVPYMLVSRRVRNTFVKGRPEEPLGQPKVPSD